MVLELEVRNTLSLPTTRYRVCKRAAWESASVCSVRGMAHSPPAEVPAGIRPGLWRWGSWGPGGRELLHTSGCFSVVRSALLPPSKCISGQKRMITVFSPSSLPLSRNSVTQTWLDSSIWFAFLFSKDWLPQSVVEFEGSVKAIK